MIVIKKLKHLKFRSLNSSDSYLDYIARLSHFHYISRFFPIEPKTSTVLSDKKYRKMTIFSVCVCVCLWKSVKNAAVAFKESRFQSRLSPL